MLPADTFKNKVAFVTGGGTGLGISHLNSQSLKTPINKIIKFRKINGTDVINTWC